MTIVYHSETPDGLNKTEEKIISSSQKNIKATISVKPRIGARSLCAAYVDPDSGWPAGGIVTLHVLHQPKNLMITSAYGQSVMPVAHARWWKHVNGMCREVGVTRHERKLIKAAMKDFLSNSAGKVG